MKQVYFLIIVSCVWFLPLTSANAQEKANPQGKFITVNAAKIYYEEYGQGEPLILLHGFGRTLADWKPYIGEYSKTYHVIAWDMRGHGRSSSPDTSSAFYHLTATKDLLALIQKLNLEKVRAIGHSSGGIIILNAAILEPERFEAIVPVSAQMHFSVQTREFIEKNAKPEAYYEFNKLEGQHGKTKGRLIARQFYRFWRLYGDPAITPDQLAMIKARALIVHGDNDFVPVAQAFEIYKHIPNAHLWVVPNGWHMPHVGAQNEVDFTRITLEFLNGKWSKERKP